MKAGRAEQGRGGKGRRGEERHGKGRKQRWGPSGYRRAGETVTEAVKFAIHVLLHPCPALARPDDAIKYVFKSPALVYISFRRILDPHSLLGGALVECAAVAGSSAFL